MKNIWKDQIDFKNGELWSNVSEEAKDLVNLLLQKDPQKRLSADQILLHPWFNDVLADIHSDDALGDDVSPLTKILELNSNEEEIINVIQKSQSTLSNNSRTKSE